MLFCAIMATEGSTCEGSSSRRRRLVKGLLLGSAAVGLPALANALIARRSEKLGYPAWGRQERFSWQAREISFQRFGLGAPLVLLHSLGPGHDSEEWKRASELLARSFRVYAPDLLGWGRSDKPAITYDGALYIQLLEDFLRRVVAERCVLVAAGLPATYAVQVAVDHPELVSHLGLVVPSGIQGHRDEPDMKDAWIHRLLRFPVVGRSSLNLFTSRPALGQYLRNEVFRSAEKVDASRLDHYYRSSHQPGAHAPLAAYLSGYLNHSIAEAVSRLKTPLWLAWGRHAKNPPIESADLWLHHVPSAELDVFEDCGNYPHLEAASRFSQHLESFLARFTD
ncbi:MAG: alpha/beta fold hydrolase [Thermoanaerobaculia bacterium]